MNPEDLAFLDAVAASEPPPLLPTPPGPPTADEAFSADVEAEAQRLRVRQAAARKVAQECAGALGGLPPVLSLAEFLAVEDEPQRYRVDRLWPVGGRVVLAAAYKAGKSTVTANLVRSLVDGAAFLDAFAVEQVEKVVIVDDELDERTLRRWLREQGVTNVDRVSLVALRGRVGSFDLLDAETRRQWAKQLAGAGVLVLDCLRPVLDALGLNEHTDAGRFLVALDALLTEAGIGECLVVHHMGHGAERSRGDSRLLDWPDVSWTLVREDPEDPRSPRYFSAYGRDVNQPEARLDYDEARRRLSLVGGSRRDTAADEAATEVLDALGEAGAMSGRQLETRLRPEHTRANIRHALRRLVEAGQVLTEPGPRRSTMHRLNPQCASAPSVRQRTSDECASAPIERRTHSHTESVSVPGALDLGPCALCGQPTRRYGDEAQPLCVACRSIS